MFAIVLLQSFVTGLGDRIRRDEEGATAVEYGLMVSLIAVIIIAAVTAIGVNLDVIFQQVADAIAN